MKYLSLAVIAPILRFILIKKLIEAIINHVQVKMLQISQMCLHFTF